MRWTKRISSALRRGGRPALVLLLTLSMTSVAMHFALSSIKQSEHARFERAVAARERALKERLETHADTLRASSGLFAAGSDVEERQFRRFFDRLELRARYPGVQALGWLPKDERNAATATFLVRFIEPAADAANRGLIGWNAHDSPPCRLAMAHARDTGRVAATERVRFPTSQADSNGFFMFAPAYVGGDAPASRQARQDRLRGFVFGYFRLDPVFGFDVDAPIAVRIYDRPQTNAQRLLYASHPNSQRAAAGNLVAEHRFELGARAWTLTAWATPAFQRAPYEYIVLLIGLGGLLISALLAGITWSEATARAGAEAAAAGLRASREALLEADEAKNRFLTVLGHELRNPLGAVSNALHVMRMQGLDDPVATRALETAERQVRRQTRLVDDLLDLSRIGTGKLELQREPMDLNLAARQVVSLLQQEATARKQDLILDTSETPVNVHGDPVRLEQVVWNLLSNAIKYTPDGGEIRVLVRREGSTTSGEAALLRVRDTGLGLTEEEREAVFDMFAQAAPDSARSRGGLGVGLSLVRQIIELHGGSIDALSEGRGSGTEFVVRIPLTGRRPERSAEPSRLLSASEVEVSRRRVLVVEDDADARDMLVELLGKLGFAAQAAADGERGIQAAKDQKPGLMLVDLDLPGISGFEVAREVRAMPGGDNVFLVALTGFGQREERQRALDAGFDEHMLKPLDLTHLRQVLEREAGPFGRVDC